MEKSADRPAPLRTTPHPPATLSTSLGSTSPLQWGSTSLVWCVVRGEGGPFYSPRRSVPARIKYGKVDNHHQEDKSESPAKMHLDGCTSRFSRTCGSAGPTLLILAPPFVLDTAWWAPILCMSVPGLCTLVFFVKWAHLASVTRDAIFCGFSCVFFLFSSYSGLVLLESTNHQHSWNSSVITPITTVDVHSLSVYVGVDGIYFVLNSHQQHPHT